MINYPKQWNLPFTILALVLCRAAGGIGFRKQLLSVKGLVSGFFVSLLMFITASAFGIAAQTLFSNIYLRLDQIRSLDDLILIKRTILLEGNKWIAGSLVITLILLIGLRWLFRRKVTDPNLFFGGIIIWVLLSIVSAFYLPGAGYIFLWPLIFSLAGLLIGFSTQSRIKSNYLVLFSLSAVSSILIYFPVGYILFQALMMLGAGIPLALLSLPAGLLLSALSLFLQRSESFSSEFDTHPLGLATRKAIRRSIQEV
jgi:hypothetical protein